MIASCINSSVESTGGNVGMSHLCTGPTVGLALGGHELLILQRKFKAQLPKSLDPLQINIEKHNGYSRCQALA